MHLDHRNLKKLNLKKCFETEAADGSKIKSEETCNQGIKKDI